jgi:quinol monooxygenase YgiN
MTTIVANSEVITAITVFTVAPENQQRLIDLLIRAAEEIAISQPGFISINVHKSLDETHVISYSQWESREAFEDILQDTTVIPYVQQILKIATIKPNFYDVVAVIHADNQSRASSTDEL